MEETDIHQSARMEVPRIRKVNRQWMAVWFWVRIIHPTGNKAAIVNAPMVIPQFRFLALHRHIRPDTTAAAATIPNRMPYHAASYCPITALHVLYTPEKKDW